MSKTSASAFIITLFVVAYMTANGDGFAQTSDLLAQDRHVSNVWHVFGPTEKQAKENYDLQIQAIRSLEKVGDPKNIAIVIPYLDYSTSPIDILAYDVKHYKNEDLADLEQLYPALAVILNTPGSNREVIDYLNAPNVPLNLQLTLLQVLRLEDTKVFETQLQRMRDRYNTDSAAKKYITCLARHPNLPFRGILNLNQMPS